MNELNKDGLKPGAPVDFETMKRIERERSKRSAGQKPKRRGRPPKAAQ